MTLKNVIKLCLPSILLMQTAAYSREYDEVGFNTGLVSIFNDDSYNFKNNMIGATYQFNHLTTYDINPRIDIEYVNISDYENDKVNSLFKTSINTIYTIDSDEPIKPYLLLGMGYEVVNDKINDVFENQAFLQGGIGGHYVINEYFNINVEGKVLQVLGGKKQDNEIILTAGVSYAIGKRDNKSLVNCPVKISAPDKDHDGITDILDQCPDTPCNFIVDTYGCPIKATLRVNFNINSAVIKDESLYKIENFADFLKTNKGTTVELSGHTDSDGSDAHNLVLSQKRAEAIMSKLIDYGVSANRLSATGHGESLPISKNNSEYGKSLNRRVEASISYPKR